jgi:glycine/D-amino acid oxidase-like deaminating enzyme
MRLTSKTIQPQGAPVRIFFNGREIPALAGETVAACLSAAEILIYRQTPSGAPRGLHCGMGACFDCVVSIDGRIGQRACLARVADGMVVSSLPPENLALLPAPDGREAETWSVDVLVVGAGPAGLSAAAAAGEAGASVTVLDERDSAGGQYMKQLATSHTDSMPDSQFRAGQALRSRALAAGAVIQTGATVWGGFAADEVTAVQDGRAITWRPRRLILAPGAHERPVPLPGWTLPGVMTTGALQTLARAQRVAPGRRIVIAGNGPLNLQLACELLAGGLKVAAVVEAASRPGLSGAALRMLRLDHHLAREGLSYMNRLDRAGVKLLWDSQVVALEGDGQVSTAVIDGPSGQIRMAVDVVALNMGFQPEVGLARALEVPHRFVDVGLGHLATVADADGRTSVEGVFAVGDGASLGGSRVAVARGRLAGLAAARDLGFVAADPAPTRQELQVAEAFQAALWEVFRPPTFVVATLADSTIVCRCEEVTAGRLRGEIAGGLVSLAALKKATRAGMGRCQGRFCAATVARLCPQSPDEFAFAAPRAPVRPVPAAPLMFEAPEFKAEFLKDPPPPQILVPLSVAAHETRHCDVLVIGGGAVGLSTAYFLAKSGADVMVAERNEAGLAASTANAGSLHAQMLSYDFDEHTHPSEPHVQALPLGTRSIGLWKDIAAAAGEALGISTPGGLMVADREDQLPWLRAKSALEVAVGVESHVVGANELRSMAPHLSDRLVGAVFCPAEGRIDPLRGCQALLRLSQQHGARVLRGAEVSGIAREGNAWRVHTSRGDVVAGRIVNAAGPYAGRIAAMVGLDLPVGGTIQQVIVTEPAPRMVEHLVAYAHRHLSLKQQDSGGLLIGGGWYGSFDRSSGRSRNLRGNIEGNLWVAGQVLPALRGLAIIRTWTGVALQIDRAPILGEAPGLPGFFNAVTSTGYTLSPILGRMTADLLTHGEAIPAAFTLARFQ